MIDSPTNTEYSLSTTTEVSNMNPWEVQTVLMTASDQIMAPAPEMNHGVLLYAALNLEEGREILAGLTKTLNRLVASGAHDNVIAPLQAISASLTEADRVMKQNSLAVREQLKVLPKDFRAEMTEAEVIEVTDGTMDLTVTNSGLAVSFGLDGAACYAEVAQSNLSKRNPDTGVIDKTADGKWIKGRDYREPNLHPIIFGKSEGKSLKM